MHIQQYPIIPALQPYVKLICTMDCNEAVSLTYLQVLPDACVEVFINYSSSPVAIINNNLHQRSIVSFRMSQATAVQMRKGAGCLAICFYPGMAYHFFNIPMQLLSNTTTPLADLWGTLAAQLEEKIALANNNHLRAEIIQQQLLHRLSLSTHDPVIHYCLKQNQAGYSVPVSQWSTATGISQRQLARKFQQHLGLSPKEYLRVSRFIYSLQQLKNYPASTLTQIAYQSGYYDQAHFIRDYKAYTDHTPAQVAKANHILF